MKRGGAIWLPVVLAAGLQCTFLAGWQPSGVVPDLALIVLIRFGLVSSPAAVLVAAVSGGLVLGLSASDLLGLQSIYLVVVGLGLIGWQRLGISSRFWAYIGLVALASALFGLTQLVRLALAHGSVGALAERWVATVIVDLVLAVIIYAPLGVVVRWLAGPREEVA